MSAAIKCDRCKKCFDPWKPDQRFGSICGFTIRNSESMKRNEVIYRDEKIDLCPICLADFELWFSELDRKNNSEESLHFEQSFVPVNNDPLAL